MNPEGSAGASETSAAADNEEKRHSNKPKYSRFTQQELPACKPILSPRWVITTYITVGIIFIPIGLASLFASEDVVEIVDRYDKGCIPSNYSTDALSYIQSTQTDKTCIRRLTVTKHMKSPIFIYYQLDNFYQNHRRYVKSKSEKQLRSSAYESDVDDCDPEATTHNSPIVPCGLIAWSLFNDTYGFSLQNKTLEVSKKDIVWKSDQEHKFGSNVYPKNFQSEGLIGGAKLNESIPLSKQVDLIVWMRLAALPTFRKLYGKIEVDLEANQQITVTVQNNYNTYSFGGKKKLVLSTTSWIGGKNNFLGIGYLTVGGLSLLMARSFILFYVLKPRYESNGFYDQTTLPGNVGLCSNRTALEASDFATAANQVLKDLQVATPKINGFYAATKTEVSGGSSTVYAVAQCAETVSKSGCEDCLGVAYANLQGCSPDAEGRAVDAGCFLRYSDTAFFPDNQTTEIASFLGGGSSNNNKAIIGGAVGGGGGLLLVILGIILWYQLSRKAKTAPRGTVVGATELQGPVSYNYKDLKSATKNFSEEYKLGEGGFGDVYKAWKLYEDEMHMNLVDEALDENEYTEQDMKKIIEIALMCTQSLVSSRPTMSEVVLLLSERTMELTRPTRPTFVDNEKKIRGDSSTSTGLSATDASVTVTEFTGR